MSPRDDVPTPRLLPVAAAAEGLTPGAFLRRCRQAAGLTLDDVALRTETTPPISARARADLLATIESDIAPVSYRDVAVLQTVYGFAWTDMADQCAPIAAEPALRTAA